MAIPDTDTFTLQDVVNEINPTTDDLVDCFADAVSNKFDSGHEGDKDRLLNFRNYDGAVNSAFLLSNPEIISSSACGKSTPNTRYHNNTTGSLPKLGSIVYTNSGMTTTYNGGGDWHAMDGSSKVIEISSVGLVTDLFDCGDAPL